MRKKLDKLMLYMHENGLDHSLIQEYYFLERTRRLLLGDNRKFYFVISHDVSPLTQHVYIVREEDASPRDMHLGYYRDEEYVSKMINILEFY